jgi:hypothetical protein
MIKTKKHIYCFLKVAQENNILLTANEYNFLQTKKFKITKKDKYIYKYLLYCIILKYKLKLLNDNKLLEDEEQFLLNNKILIRTIPIINIDYNKQKLAEINNSILHIKKYNNILIPKKNKLIGIFNLNDIYIGLLRFFN